MSYPILIKNVYKSLYEKGKLSFSLKNINLIVKKGSSFALLGPNGAGKTTLIYLILGLLKPDKGTIHIFGKNPLERDALARVNFMMTEQYEPWALKVKNILNFYAEVYNIPNKHQKINELCEIFNLKKLMNKSLYKLSSGEQTRVMLARALINDPKLLILDEPTHNLDSYSAEKIRNFLLEMNRRGITIFFTSHNANEVERLAKEVALIKDGKILMIATKRKLRKKYKSVRRFMVTYSKEK